jgi:homocysteine S-methyltransferase
MKPVLERMKDSPLIFDGASGTMFYIKGVFLNACYDELCLRRPQMVRELHREYLEAGAEVLETNTFGANPVRLGEHGLAEETENINREAVRLAKEVAGDQAYVAGSVGPCMRPGMIWTGKRAQEIGAAYERQIGALVEAGADFVLLETFSYVAELELGAAIARKAGVPVFASFTVTDNGETALGVDVAVVVEALSDNGNIDAVGLNCGGGPATMYDWVQKSIPLCPKPFFVQPNAGMPKEVDGRRIYLSTPEYFTEYAKRFQGLGVSGVGGCCGTTPAHIREMARALKPLGAVAHRVVPRSSRPAPGVEPIPMAEKSEFGRKLAAGEPVCSIELTPPRSVDLSSLLAKAQTCADHGIDAINIPDGPRASSRISPMIAALMILQKTGIEPILHYCCRDRNLIGMQSDLLGGYSAGLHNFLIVTGDPPKLGDYPDATGVFDVDAIGLTHVANGLNHGLDIGGNGIKPPTGILIGVGANPCAISPQEELDRFAQKVEAGAEFAITQPVFDPAALLRFIDSIEARGCAIPVVAGVWPLVSYKNAEFMNNEVPGVEVPESVLERMRACKGKEEGVETGVQIAREVCEAIRSRVAGFQVSAPFERVQLALQVLGRA